jgi:nickel-dependent lactate racemase
MMEEIKMYRVLQAFDKSKLKNIPEIIAQKFQAIRLDQQIKPGMKIGITVGSRGVDNLQLIIKTVIEEVKKRKGSPFILPAMGSHGNANIEGQKQVLRSYGIAEEGMGVPIQATMDVVELGKLKNGLPVYFDKYAFQADGIIVVNRVKAHTVYKAKIESGLHKMLAVGLGNHQGATSIHCLGPKYIPDNVMNAAKIILKKAPIICGLGILENAYDEVRKIVAVLPGDFMQVEQELLKECKEIAPTLPVKDIDVLIVQEMGKDISGAGLDTNVVGGVKAYLEGDYDPPKIDKMVVLDLTKPSHGNAIGISIADIITKRLYDKIDFDATYKNVITCGYLDRAKIPVVLKTDKEAIEVALNTIFKLPGTEPRVILIRSTLKLDEMFVSENIWKKIKNTISTIGNWEKLAFNDIGNLTLRV